MFRPKINCAVFSYLIPCNEAWIEKVHNDSNLMATCWSVDRQLPHENFHEKRTLPWNILMDDGRIPAAHDLNWPEDNWKRVLTGLGFFPSFKQDQALQAQLSKECDTVKCPELKEEIYFIQLTSKENPMQDWWMVQYTLVSYMDDRLCMRPRIHFSSLMVDVTHASAQKFYMNLVRQKPDYIAFAVPKIQTKKQHINVSTMFAKTAIFPHTCDKDYYETLTLAHTQKEHNEYGLNI
jgi:hypothetical protein